MVTRRCSHGLRRAALWVSCVVAWAVGCGASRRTVDDDVASAGDESAAGQTDGGGGKAGRGAIGGTSAIGGTRPTGGTGAIGGTRPTGGTNANAGTSSTEGGTGGSRGGLGGRGGNAGKGGSDTGDGGSLGGEDGEGADGSGGRAVECTWLEAKHRAPTVVLLVDTSSSMWEVMPPAWNLLQTGLMYPDSSLGVVAALENHVRFGFASYKGYEAAAEDDPACATMATLAPALDNRAALDFAFGEIGYSETERWATPTNYAIDYTAAALLADAEAPGEKFILLFTDGNPNTCKTVEPQCGQDLAVRAAQDAYANGIGLRVVGLGDIVFNPNAGCPPTARCGVDHLQDLANAGIGAPVAPPPNCDDPASDSCAYRFESCVENGVLQASYTPGAIDVGTPGVLMSTSLDTRDVFYELVTGMVRSLIPCTLELSAAFDPAVGAVLMGGNVELTHGDPNGFEIDGTELELSGTACDAYRNGVDIAVRAACSDGH